MSRETDSSSSGPQGGRGGSAYPPGADPYGSADAGADPSAADREASQDEPRTETRLTTRIRINIPGSRPIPPVVMRKPVGESEEADAAQADERDPAETAGPAAQTPTVPAPASPPPSSQAPQGPAAGTGQGAEFTQETSDWFAPRKSPKPAPSSGSAAGEGAASGGRSDLPYFSGSGPDGETPGTRPDGYEPDPAAAGHPGHPDTPPDGFPRSTPPSAAGGRASPNGGPDGLTSGPVTGDMPFGQPQGGPFGAGPQDAPPEAAPHAGPYVAEPPASSTLGLGTGPAPFAPGGAGESLLQEGRPVDPGAPADTGAFPAPGITGGERVTSDTLVSGIPRVPSSEGPDGGPSGSGESGDSGNPGDSGGDGAAAAAAPSGPAGRSSRGAPDGRSKLMLAGAGLLGLLGIAYGAGLLLDHADVPNGTKVLGVDIGGTTKHKAVNTLDAALGDARTLPFTVSAAGKQTKLRPSVAGLTLDTEETVRKAAGRDYNPVSVIGSLFGAERVAEPAIEVDKEKMASALAPITKQSGGGAPTDGQVRFVRGKAIALPGKPHKGIDPVKAGATLEKAYRERAITGRNSPVALPVSMRQPEVGQPELNRAIQEFGKPAMSGMVTVKAGNASIKFSPQKSLPKFLSMKPINGKLIDSYNLPALQKLYGTTFAGVKIARGNGSRTPVMPQDVVSALRPALKETDPAKRIAVIPLNPQ